MKLQKHKLYKVHWLDAGADAHWTDEEDVRRDVARLEAGVVYHGLYLFSTARFHVFTSGAFVSYLKEGPQDDHEDIADYFAVPKGMVISITPIR